ncbi:hypothetical protein IMY05_C4491000400 [Salix suchowensis]|nr:hypothetical protein IMY05_C4491000400 [Salix suchowensis]
MKSFFQRHSESRPGPSKPSSKSRHKRRASVDSVQVTPPIASAPPEKQRDSEDRPYAPSRPTAQNGIAPGVPASAIHGQTPHVRSQPTQLQAVPARATQPVNGSPDDHDARGRRSTKPPTPLSSSEHVSGIHEPKTARPSRQRGGQEPGPPATAPAPEIWIPPSTTTQPTNHVPSRPSQDRERMLPHREEGRRDQEHGEKERERERDRAREREKERKREKENKRDEEYRARDVNGVEKDYTRSRDAERHRERERRREYPSSGTKDRDRDRDRTRDRAGESGRGREGDRTRERYEYERAERERMRVEEERYARTREQAERDKVKEASRTAEPHQSRSRSKSRRPTREFLEEGDSSDSSRRKPPVSYRYRTREARMFPHLRKVREPPSPIPAVAVGSMSASQQPVYPKHALSNSMMVHLPADPRSRSGRLDAGADNVPASGSENERERTRVRLSLSSPSVVLRCYFLMLEIKPSSQRNRKL